MRSLPMLLLRRVAFLPLLACWMGCQPSDSGPSFSAPSELAAFGDLARVSKTHHRELRQEVARLINEEATPAQLSRGQRRSSPPSKEVSPQLDLAAAIEQIWPEKTSGSLERRVARIYPADRFEFTSQKLRVASAVSEEFSAQREKYRELAGAAPLEGFRLDLSRGLAADTSFVHAVELGNRVEALQAAVWLDRGDTQQAIGSLDVLLQMTQLLAREQHLVPRVAAARLRGEALRILEAIADHPYATAETLRQLLARIDHQISTWTPDAAAWLGERAQGLHTYELVRGGYLLSLLEYKEILAFGDEYGGINRLGRQVQENIDVDQLFYLKSMRSVIDSCARPFFERRPVLRRIRRQLNAMRDTMSYPFVADQLLLGELETGHRWQALDRARCLAWRLALSLSLGREPDEMPVNPLTGFEFIVERRSDSVLVDAVDPQRGERPVIVRKLSRDLARERDEAQSQQVGRLR